VSLADGTGYTYNVADGQELTRPDEREGRGTSFSCGDDTGALLSTDQRASGRDIRGLYRLSVLGYNIVLGILR